MVGSILVYHCDSLCCLMMQCAKQHYHLRTVERFAAIASPTVLIRWGMGKNQNGSNQSRFASYISTRSIPEEGRLALPHESKHIVPGGCDPAVHLVLAKRHKSANVSTFALPFFSVWMVCRLVSDTTSHANLYTIQVMTFLFSFVCLCTLSCRTLVDRDTSKTSDVNSLSTHALHFATPTTTRTTCTYYHVDACLRSNASHCS